jgi:hypothetical protein
MGPDGNGNCWKMVRKVAGDALTVECRRPSFDDDFHRPGACARPFPVEAQSPWRCIPPRVDRRVCTRNFLHRTHYVENAWLSHEKCFLRCELRAWPGAGTAPALSAKAGQWTTHLDNSARSSEADGTRTSRYTLASRATCRPQVVHGEHGADGTPEGPCPSETGRFQMVRDGLVLANRHFQEAARKWVQCETGY